MSEGTWYRTGLVSLANGSDLVAGVGTEFIANVLPGAIFFAPEGLYEVDRAVSDTMLKLVKPYTGPTVAGAEFEIAPTQGAVVQATKQLQTFLSELGPLNQAWQAGELQARGLVLKGVRNTVEELPVLGNQPGDGWMVDGHLWVWSGTAWSDQGNTAVTAELDALRTEAVDAAAAAEATRLAYEDRVYPGVYSTPPSNKPHSGAASVQGDRCTILVGGVAYEHLRSGGGWVIPNIDAANLALSTGAGRVGHRSETVAVALDKGLQYDTDFLWTPPAQPSGSGGAGSIINNNTATHADYIALWESLRAAHPEYITRVDLGMDTSGTYPMHKYIFAPARFEKTILITCGVHAFERISMLGIFLFLRHLANDSASSPQLSYLRERCRIVVIPSLNPWGISQGSPGGRYNSRGVDINRNWDYKWAAYNPTSEGLAAGAKGTAPFSEAETQYAKALIDDYPDAVAYWDVHDVNAKGVIDGEQKYIGYHPEIALGAHTGKIFDRILQHFGATGTPDHFIGWSAGPTAFNYGASRRLHSGNPEATTDGAGSGRWTSGAMQRAVGWYGNIILRSADLNKIGVEIGPRFARCYYQAGAAGETPATRSRISSVGAYAELTDFSFDFPTGSDGVLLVDITVSGQVNGVASGGWQITSITPKLGQAQNYLQAFSEFRTDSAEGVIETPQGRRGQVRSSGMIAVAASSTKLGEALKIGVAGKVDVGEFLISRLEINVFFIPADGNERLKIFKSTGRAGMVNAMQQTFPIQ